MMTVATDEAHPDPSVGKSSPVAPGEESDESADDGAHTLEQSGWVQPTSRMTTSSTKDISTKSSTGVKGVNASSEEESGSDDDEDDDEDLPVAIQATTVTDLSSGGDGETQDKIERPQESGDVSSSEHTNRKNKTAKLGGGVDVHSDSTDHEMELDQGQDRETETAIVDTMQDEEIVDEEDDDDDDDPLEIATVKSEADGKKLSKIRKRRVNFTPHMDNKLLSLILDVKPYSAARGYVARSWEEVSKNFNLHCGGEGRVNSTQDTCKNRFQNVMDKYNANGKLSGTIAEVAEKRRLLVAITHDIANEKGVEREEVIEAGAHERSLSQHNMQAGYENEDEQIEDYAGKNDVSSSDKGTRNSSGGLIDREEGGSEEIDPTTQWDRDPPISSVSGTSFGKNITLTMKVGGSGSDKADKRSKAHQHSAAPTDNSHSQGQAQTQTQSPSPTIAQKAAQHQHKFTNMNPSFKWHSHSHSPNGNSGKKPAQSSTGAYTERSEGSNHSKQRRPSNGELAYGGDSRSEKRARYSRPHENSVDPTDTSEVYRNGSRSVVPRSPTTSSRNTHRDTGSSGIHVRRKSITNGDTSYEATDRKYADREAERELRLLMFDTSRRDSERRFQDELIERQRDRELRTRAVELDHKLRLREIAVKEREADDLAAIKASMDDFSERLAAIERRLR